MKPIRRRLSYANITATLALFFAMSGGALAASHYLITSKKQISPKVLKQLKGAKGATGPAGAAGPAGPAGAAGAAGAAGPAGTAVAYTTVAINSAGNPALGTNSGFTGVTNPAPGEYCLPVPAAAASGAGLPVVSADGGTFQVAFYSPQQCGSNSYEVGTSEPLKSGEGFSIVVP